MNIMLQSLEVAHNECLFCTDCELVALLEDDSGMELLVCNKIISLDLPVKEVYKKVWLAQSTTVSVCVCMFVCIWVWFSELLHNLHVYLSTYSIDKHNYCYY